MGRELRGWMLGKEELAERRRVFGGRKREGVPRDEKETGFLGWEFACLGELLILFFCLPFLSIYLVWSAWDGF